MIEKSVIWSAEIYLCTRTDAVGFVVPRDQLTLSAAEPDNKGQKFESKFWPIISRCLLV